MRAKSEKRLLAEKLRREQGLSYSEIHTLTGISKSTLSYWLKDTPLTRKQEERLRGRLKRNQATFAARALPINRERYHLARKKAILAGSKIFDNLPNSPSVDELALSMLYLGDGSKTGGAVRLASVKPDILRYFITALKSLYNIDMRRLSCRLHLIEAVREKEDEQIHWWVKQLGLPRESFRRSAFDPRSQLSNVTEDYHGVCVVTYSDVYLKLHIMSLARTYIHSIIQSMR